MTRNEAINQLCKDLETETNKFKINKIKSELKSYGISVLTSKSKMIKNIKWFKEF